MIDKNNSGFTLFETLVVFSIISLLIGLGLFSYIQSAKTSRDATRKADIQTISNALEKYKSDHGSYPTDILPASLSQYLSTIPVDPKTKNQYEYEELPAGCVVADPNNSPCTSYELSAILEIKGIYKIDNYGLVQTSQ